MIIGKGIYIYNITPNGLLFELMHSSCSTCLNNRPSVQKNVAIMRPLIQKNVKDNIKRKEKSTNVISVF